mmetsp:Transcript_26621/g.63839  ORF Transcript_26621/g.63839 Transcript_26621/m.63839 type:complete len:346 (-) Transcript_26621:702-1739(-)
MLLLARYLLKMVLIILYESHVGHGSIMCNNITTPQQTPTLHVLRLRFLVLPLPTQPRFDRLFQRLPPVQHTLHIRRLVARPCVLHQSVGLHHIIAYLGAPARLHHITPDGVYRLYFLLLRYGQQLSLETTQRELLIHALASFLRAFYGYPAGQVLHPHGCFDLVHVLSPLAAAAHGRDLQLFLGYLYFLYLLVLQNWHHVHAGKCRLPLVVGVERAQPHEPVRTLLALEPSVGIGALHQQLHALVSHDVSLTFIYGSNFHVGVRRVSTVHSVQHGDPIAGLCPAGASGQYQTAVRSVVGATQQRRQLVLLRQFQQLRGAGLAFFRGEREHLLVFASAAAFVLGRQ